MNVLVPLRIPRPSRRDAGQAHRRGVPAHVQGRVQLHGPLGLHPAGHRDRQAVSHPACSGFPPRTLSPTWRPTRRASTGRCSTLDFVVVSDPFLTPTAVAFADVFLPAVHELRAQHAARYGGCRSRGMKKVTQFADVRSDDDHRHGPSDSRLHPENFPWTDDIGWTNDILVNDTPGYDGDFEQLCKDVYVYPGVRVPQAREGPAAPRRAARFQHAVRPHRALQQHLRAVGLRPAAAVGGAILLAVRLAGAVPSSTRFVLTTGARSVEFFHSEHRQLETSREFHPDPLFEMSPEGRRGRRAVRGGLVLDREPSRPLPPEAAREPLARRPRGARRARLVVPGAGGRGTCPVRTCSTPTSTTCCRSARTGRPVTVPRTRTSCAVCTPARRRTAPSCPRHA